MEDADPLAYMSLVAANGALSRASSETSTFSDSPLGLQ